MKAKCDETFCGLGCILWDDQFSDQFKQSPGHRLLSVRKSLQIGILAFDGGDNRFLPGAAIVGDVGGIDAGEGVAQWKHPSCGKPFAFRFSFSRSTAASASCHFFEPESRQLRAVQIVICFSSATCLSR
jgi:hypothetical protein